jgi:hypothetical protein
MSRLLGNFALTIALAFILIFLYSRRHARETLMPNNTQLWTVSIDRPRTPMELQSLKTQLIGEPYDLSIHRKLSEITDPLAQQAEQELISKGLNANDITYAVRLQMTAASGGPAIMVDAIRFDRSYDFDAAVLKWKNSKSTGYRRFSEMPVDAPFRVHGKSMGNFIALWIGLNFRREYEKQTGVNPDKDMPMIVNSVTVEAWGNIR